MKIFFFIATVALTTLLLANPVLAYDDSFENWKNPNVAEGWNSHVEGVPGGEFNQVYSCGQGISCRGDGINFKSVYRDFLVTPGHSYYFSVSAISNSTNAAGMRDPSCVRFWVQFDDEVGHVIATHGMNGNEAFSYWISTGPGFYYGVDPVLDPLIWKQMSLRYVTAPLGSHHVRVILQVMGGAGGGTVFQNVIACDTNNIDPSQAPYMLTRNTEWTENSSVASGWSAYSEGGGPGDYERRTTGESSQGISASGNGSEYRQVYKDFAVAPGEYELSIWAISNSANIKGEIDPSYVHIYVQYMDKAGNVLSTFRKTGADRIWSGSWQATTLSENKIRSTLFETTAPPGAHHARIILRVYGGTGGGTIFNDLSFRSK